MPLRKDGMLYASGREPDDHAAAVYFQVGDRQMVFACDRWDRIEHNMRAIEKTIGALRGIERWGASDMKERAFSAFEALPAPSPDNEPHWSEILEIGRHANSVEIEAAYRLRAKFAHPDAGGSSAQMTTLNLVRQAAHEARQ